MASLRLLRHHFHQLLTQRRGRDCKTCDDTLSKRHLPTKAKHRKKEESTGLTENLEEPLGLGLPPDAKYVDGHSGGDDAEADGALHWSLPDGDKDEEEARQHKTGRQQDVHLQRDERSSTKFIRKFDSYDVEFSGLKDTGVIGPNIT